LTAILGISAFYHDSAAALVVDGDIIAAAQEERFTRKKHDAGFPAHAIAYCLSAAGMTADDVDYIAFYDKPLRKFERLLETYLAFAPRGFSSFCQALPIWLREKLYMRRTLRKAIQQRRRCPLVFLEHHESHAASAFFPSPFEEAAILTMDGVGEWATTTWGIGTGNRIELKQQLGFPHSLGLLYSAFTYYCGFQVNSGEYKLMGLAPYGKPVYADTIYQHLLDLKADGSFRLNMDYFNYCTGLTMTSRKFHRLFGGPPRQPESTLTQRHMDMAASIQAVIEEVVLRLGRDIHRRTGQKQLVLAGGVALNCVANGRLLREGPFESLWIQPAAGDAGGALGSALFVWHQLLAKPRSHSPGDRQQGSLLGPRFSSEEIQQFLREKQMPFVHLSAPDLLEEVARSLADGKIVGWFQGRMEFGPRALGNRSILADPRCPDMQSRLNVKIKNRESFRPFAPAILADHAADWFDLPSDHDSPYMLLTAALRPEHRAYLTPEQRDTMHTHPDLVYRLAMPRSPVPAVTHIDCSARLQTVDAARNPLLYQLLTAFHDRTGCPMLVNTSLNVRGEPIACTPHDAYRCFRSTEMDILVLEDCLLSKANLAPVETQSRESYVRSFPPD
jgi:carbamoyltransferase